MQLFPTLFISHGAPDLPLHSSAARSFLATLGSIGKPKAILIVSAHWETHQPVISEAERPNTIYDFRGFDPRLNSLSYPALGAPELAQKVTHLLKQADIASGISNRGLDHGAWIPLMLMYPDADIPVTQLSIQPERSPLDHFQLGKALAPLTQEGILILASGSATHNLREFGKYSLNSVPPFWVQKFSNWLSQTLQHRDVEALLNYRAIAPYARQNHPTEEHLLPLFVALGAGGQTNISELHHSYTHGVLSMAAYAFS